MSLTINMRDIRDQEIAQPGPKDDPITPGGETPLTAAGNMPRYRLPEEEGPSATEIISGTRPKKQNRRLQKIIKWSREELTKQLNCKCNSERDRDEKDN